MRAHVAMHTTALLLLMACAQWLPRIAAVDDTSSSSGDEPATPVCRYIPKNSLAFCSMVDYVAVVDANDLDGAAFDAKAKFYYENADVVLQRFGCHARYSLYKCDDCRDAYKYWVCSIKFQKCGSVVRTDHDDNKNDANNNRGSSGDSHVYASALCTSSSDAACVSGTTGRHRTCLSLCEDVVRKCPYVLNFQCPTVRSTSNWTSCATRVCHKLAMTDTHALSHAPCARPTRCSSQATSQRATRWTGRRTRTTQSSHGPGRSQTRDLNK